MSGFGGAIKNVGMGAASRRGKMAQHCDVAPSVKAKLCVGCGACLEACAHGAIELIDREVKTAPAANPGKKAVPKKLARTNPERCVGCGACIHTCPNGAIQIDWGKDLPPFMERMVEYTVGALKGKENHSLFLNFLMNISPACDCYPNSDAAIVPDIGILAATDPVAIDQASMDLLNAQAGLPSSCLKPEACGSGSDKVRAVYPHIQWEHQMEYAEKVGLGSRSYKLVRVK